jgi:hypothetical protein
MLHILLVFVKMRLWGYQTTWLDIGQKKGAISNGILLLYMLTQY